MARFLPIGPRVAKGQTVNRGQDIDPIRGYADLEDEAGV
jgi:hypothetical protein